MDAAAVQKVLADLGQACGFPGLVLDDNGDASLLVNGEWEVFLHYDEVAQSLIIESMLGEVRATDVEGTLERLMRANRLGIGTVSGTLSLGPQNEVILSRVVPPSSMTRQAVERALRWQATALTSLRPLLEEDAPAIPAASTSEAGARRPPPLDPRLFA